MMNENGFESWFDMNYLFFGGLVAFATVLLFLSAYLKNYVYSIFSSIFFLILSAFIYLDLVVLPGGVSVFFDDNEFLRTGIALLFLILSFANFFSIYNEAKEVKKDQDD